MFYSVFFFLQSFTSLHHKPLSVDLTVENGQRLKVIYGSLVGFHAIDVDSGSVYDLYLPTHVSHSKKFHNYLCYLGCILVIFRLSGVLCFKTEGKRIITVYKLIENDFLHAFVIVKFC